MNNISMTRGDSECIRVKIDSIKLTDGHMIEMTVRKRVNTDVVFYKKVTEFEEDGSAIIDIKPEDTSGFPFGKYVYDIQWTDANGNVKTIVKPTVFELTEEVTY